MGRGRRQWRPWPSPAMVVACVALIVALGGTGYAVTRLEADSVGRIHIREGAVGTKQVRNGSLRAEDFHRRTLRRGPRGRSGATNVVTRNATGQEIRAGDIGAISAECQGRERAVGGGGGFEGPATTNDRVVDTIPVGDERPQRKWRITLYNGGERARTPVAYVICAAP